MLGGKTEKMRCLETFEVAGEEDSKGLTLESKQAMERDKRVLMRRKTSAWEKEMCKLVYLNRVFVQSRK